MDARRGVQPSMAWPCVARPTVAPPNHVGCASIEGNSAALAAQVTQTGSHAPCVDSTSQGAGGSAPATKGYSSLSLAAISALVCNTLRPR